MRFLELEYVRYQSPELQIEDHRYQGSLVHLSLTETYVIEAWIGFVTVLHALCFPVSSRLFW